MLRGRKRFSFWLALSISGNAIVWLLMLNSKSSFSPDAPQTIFGVSVPYSVSMNLTLLELFAGAYLFGPMLLVTLFVWLIRRLSRSHPPGYCRKCGYDLRASPDRCPECGTPARSKRVPDKIAEISN